MDKHREFKYLLIRKMTVLLKFYLHTCIKWVYRYERCMDMLNKLVKINT
jgi:hypothetical protein